MKALRWLGLALAVLAAAVVIAISVAGIVTKAQRDAAVANIKKPASLVFYEELAAYRKGAAGGSAAAASPTPEAADDKRDLDDAVDTIARYERLFARKEETDDTWSELYDKVYDKKPSEWTAAERAELEAFLTENRDLILELRDLAKRGGPVCLLDFSEGLNVDLSHLAKLRDCARLLGMDATVQALNGDYPEAMADLVAGMGLADAVGEEPIMISQLVRMAMYGMACATFEAAFGPGELPPELAREFLQRAVRTGHRQRLADTLATEHAMAMQPLSDFLSAAAAPSKEELDFVAANSLTAPVKEEVGTLERIGLQLYASPIARSFYNLDQRALAELSRQMIEVTPLPYYEAKPILDGIEQDLRDHPFTRLMSDQFLLELMRVHMDRGRYETTFDLRNMESLLELHYHIHLAQGRQEAKLDLLRIGIVLEQHYVDTREYPATLDAIAADLGGAVPLDPLTGEPYHYQAQGDTFLLYSVGMNLVDDGGVHDPRDGDMVWRGEIEP